VSIDGQTLNAGSYGLYTVPNENSWEVMFYSESDNSGVPRDWDNTKVVAKTSVEVYSMPMNVETFTITFDDVSGTSAVLGILWEKTYVGIKFEVPTDKLVSKTIAAVMAASPEAGDYYNAAIYYRQQDLDIKKANEWMEKAMSLTEKPAFWQLRQQSLIYAKMGDTEKAIAVAKKSLELSKEAGNEAYIKMNTESLAEWSVK
jgi:tetratricopeptide (TPR) repeat protein